MNPIRPHQSFVRDATISPLRPTPLSCTSQISDEIFAGLLYFADVTHAGQELLKTRGVKDEDLEVAYKGFKSFIKQAQTFYKAAMVATPRASPLIYYYAFLNLAKAIITFQYPDLTTGKISHGLTHTLSTVSLDKQELKVTSGVFPLLFKMLTGEAVSEKTIVDLSTLLSYCSDIGFELQKTNFVTQSIIPALGRVTINNAKNEASLIVATSAMQLFELNKKAKSDFYSYFDEVSVPLSVVQGLFGNEVASMGPSFRFFESKTLYPWHSDKDYENILLDCRKILGRYVSYNPFNERAYSNFYLNRPLSNNENTQFNEPLAIYATFYFLSSLVRYHPVYFEERLESQDVWIVDSFLRATPLTLLRLMANYIYGENRQFFAR